VAKNSASFTGVYLAPLLKKGRAPKTAPKVLQSNKKKNSPELADSFAEASK
jgi:hypothetical protein